jgi:hypothetical protein
MPKHRLLNYRLLPMRIEVGAYASLTEALAISETPKDTASTASTKIATNRRESAKRLTLFQSRYRCHWFSACLQRIWLYRKCDRIGKLGQRSMLSSMPPVVKRPWELEAVDPADVDDVNLRRERVLPRRKR